MVVEVGLTVVEPEAEEVEKFPGAMETVDAPEVDQVSELLEPEVMVAGLAAKEVILGAEPEGGLEE